MAVLSRSRSGAGKRRLEAERGFLAATEALLDEGAAYAELSVERIASRAGRPRTAFYLYFSDRRELLMRLTESVAETLYADADRWWSGTGGRADIRPTMEAMIGTYAAHASALRAVAEAAAYDTEIGEYWRGLVQRFVDATERRLVEEGEQPGAAAQKAFVLSWMVAHSCYQQAVRERPLDDPAFVDALVEIMERGIYQ